MSRTKEQIITAIINDAVSFAVNIANDNSHGYSQRVRSLYEIDNSKSFDCSSLVLTAYYCAFLKNGLTKQARYLKENCSYTGNMLKMLNIGFEIVATNQSAHAQMQRGDIELNTTYHTALATDANNIVHARSSEGTTDTVDNSGNEIRIQTWYLYSHGWTHRLRFTGKGIDFSGLIDAESSVPAGYSFSLEPVKVGSKGTSVLLLQEILKARGYYKGSLDKDFGRETMDAVNKYQIERMKQGKVIGNGKGNGICDADMWKDLIAI